MPKFYRATRTLSSDNCPWFPDTEIVFEGTIMRRFVGVTYGCISDNGVAITFDLKDGDGPFLEVPKDAIEDFDFEPVSEPEYLQNNCVVCGEPQLGVHYHELGGES